jgi:ribonuclease VapC
VILDTSALVALAFREPGHGELLEKLDQASAVRIGTPSLTEAGIVLGRQMGNAARQYLERFLLEFQVEEIPFTEAHWRVATDAFLRFGKGRHPASLNFGDCMTYATAKLSGEPLLFVGDDFAHTDLPRA